MNNPGWITEFVLSAEITKNSKGLAVIVEDEAAIRNLYASSLEEDGFLTITASDGKSGLGLLSQHMPKVVILDIDLPIITGVDVCKKFRSIQPYPCPVIFVTAANSLAMLRDCLIAGGDDFIIKGMPLPALLERVNYWTFKEKGGMNSVQKRLCIEKTEELIEENKKFIENNKEMPQKTNYEDYIFSEDNPHFLKSIDLINDLYIRGRQHWGRSTDKTVNGQLRRFGYVTGLVNAASNTDLTMKMNFSNVLKGILTECGAASSQDVDVFMNHWHTLYENPTFSDACKIAEREYSEYLNPPFPR